MAGESWQDDAWQDDAWQDDAWQGSSTAPIATNVRFTTLSLREGGAYVVDYDYDANGGDVEGTSTVSITIDDVEVATTFSGTLPGSSSGGILAAIVTPVSTSESGSPVASIDYGPIGAAFTDTAVTVWPDQSISEIALSPPRFDPVGLLAHAGRTKTNAIRVWMRPSVETTTHATNAATATFTDDGFNVLVVSLNTEDAEDLVLQDGYATELTTGFPGWSYLNPWWTNLINAICDVNRLDAIMFDLEGGIVCTDFNSLPASLGGGTIVAAIKAAIVAASGDYSSFPGDLADSVWENYNSQTADTEAWYPYSAQVNDAITAEVAASIETHLITAARTRNPGLIASNYKRCDYSADQAVPGSTRLLPNGKFGDASAPELYDGLTLSKSLLDNTQTPRHPWLTPTTDESDPTADKSFHCLVDYAEAQGDDHINLWASVRRLGLHATEAPLIGTPTAKYDLQISELDTSGNANHATEAGSLDVTQDYDHGPGGYGPAAVAFSGTRHLLIPDALLTTTGSASFWARTEDLTTDRLILGSSAASRFHLGINSSGQWYARFGGGAVFGATAATANEWKHLAVTWTPSGAELFIDKVSVGSITGLSMSAGANASIGSFDAGSSSFWLGDIALARFYSTVIDSATITALYNEAAPKIFEAPTITKIGNQLFAQFRASDFDISGQWEKDGTPISGATKAVLTSSGSGDYEYVLDVTNDQGTVQATSDALTVAGANVNARRSHQQLNIPSGY